MPKYQAGVASLLIATGSVFCSCSIEDPSSADDSAPKVAYLVKATPRGFRGYHEAADQALVAGAWDYARDFFLECLEREPEHATVAYGLACVEAQAGYPDLAMEWLERATGWGYADAEVALWDADLSSLRSEISFSDLIESMRRNAAAMSEPDGKLFAAWDSLDKASGLDPRRNLYIWRNPDEVGDTFANSSIIECEIANRAGLIVLGDAAGYLRSLNQQTGELISKSPNLGSSVWELTVDPEGQYAFALTWSGELHRWKLTGNERVKKWRALPEHLGDREFGWPFGALLEFAPQGKRLLVAGRRRGAALMDASGEKIKTWDGSFGGYFGVQMAWSFDGGICAGIRDGRVLYFSGETGEELAPLVPQTEASYSISFGPRGERMAIGFAEGRLEVWSLTQAELLYEAHCIDPLDMQDPVRVIRFSPNGERIAFSTADSIFLQVVETESGRELWNSGHCGGRMGEIAEISWSPDSDSLWHSYDGGVMWLYHVVIGDLIDEAQTGRGLGVGRARPPFISNTGKAVFSYFKGFALADSASAQVLWCRPTQNDQSNLIHAPSGYFLGGLDHLEEFSIGTHDWDDNPQSLLRWANRLFDPKRVRASQAGVRVETAIR